MGERSEGLFRLPPDRWVGFDRGVDDVHTEVEVQINPDGTMTVLDIRHYPEPAEPHP